MNKELPTSYKVCLEFWKKAEDTSKTKKVRKNTIEMVGYKTELLEEEEDFTPTDFVIVEPLFLQSLGKRELELAAKIIAELKWNNMLWHYDHRGNNRIEKAITGLRRKGVIRRTETVDIHIVNPWFIRRGTIASTISATSSLLVKTTKVTTDQIINLKNGDTTFNPIHLIQV